MSSHSQQAHRPAPAGQGVVFLSAAQALTVIMGYAVHVAASRLLGRTGYGSFVVVLSITTWFKVLLGSCLVPGAGKIVSESHGRLDETIRTAGKWQFGLSVGLSLLLMGVAPLLSRFFHDRLLRPMLLVAAIDVAMFGLFIWSRQLLTAVRHYVKSALVMLTYDTGRAAGGLILLLAGMGAVNSVAGMSLGAAFGGVLGLIWMMRLRRVLPSEPYPGLMHRCWQWTAAALPTGLALVTLTSLDLWLVKRFASDSAAGVYAAAFAVAQLPSFMAQGLIGAVFARISGALGQGDHDLARSVAKESLRVWLVTFTPVCAVLLCAAGDIIALLFGDSYRTGAPLLMLLGVAAALGAGFRLMLALIAASDHPRLRLALVLGVLTVHVALCAGLIPRMGPLGAALATAITMTIGVTAAVVLVYRVLQVLPPALSLLRCVVAGFCMIPLGVIWDVPRLLVPGKLVALTLIYGVLLVGLRELKPTDIASLVSAFRPRR